MVSIRGQFSVQAHYLRFILSGHSRRPADCHQYATLNPFRWAKDKFQEKLEPLTSQSAKQTRASQRKARRDGTASLFAGLQEEKETVGPATTTSSKPPSLPRRRKQAQHESSTAWMHISPRKLNLLSRQVAGKPIDYAILQMQFSEKRVSTRLKNMLATAKEHAVRYKGMDSARLVVAQSWVDKGKKTSKKLFPAGRGHYGKVVHLSARMKVVLKEGHTIEEQKAKALKYRLHRVVSAAARREDKPLRNPGSMWAW